MARQTRQAKIRADNAAGSSKPRRGNRKDDKKEEDTGTGTKPTVSSKGRKRKDTPKDVEPDVPVKKGKTVKDEPATSDKMEEKGEIKKMKFSGTAPVDEECTECSTGYHVYAEKANGYVYNAMLNQTNIGFNNNKYYLIQILKHDTKYEYVTWFRWGRVGKVAGTTLERHGPNLQAAKDAFTKKYRDKTGNVWWFNRDFMKKPGKYDLLKMDYGEDDAAKKLPKEMKKEAKEQVGSKMDKRIQEVIDLIFDVKEFEACIKEMEFDIKKAPLGKLNTKQIKAGYETLKKIEKCIQSKKFGKELSQACSEFYTRIPHNFGMKVPPLIKTPQELKQKIQLLEALSDIQIAIEMIAEDEKDDKVNIKDRHYDSLGCKLEPFDTDHEEYKMVQKYITNSHGSTHKQYSMKVENVYKVEREGEKKRFKDKIGNKMLLWHGSRLTNWCGILKQGLRIAPPEAPVTGYMFGKGVYFADMASKSANYCFTSKRQPHGFLLLCEVALGQTNDKSNSDYNAGKLPKGKYSTKGLGREVPDPKGHQTLSCGTVVPLGKPKQVKPDSNFSLMYNEYIVYDVAQIQARYLVKVKFDHKILW